MIIFGNLLSDLSKCNTNQKMNPVRFHGCYKWDKLQIVSLGGISYTYLDKPVGIFRAKKETDHCCFLHVIVCVQVNYFDIPLSQREKKISWVPSPWTCSCWTKSLLGSEKQLLFPVRYPCEQLFDEDASCSLKIKYVHLAAPCLCGERKTNFPSSQHQWRSLSKRFCCSVFHWKTGEVG